MVMIINAILIAVVLSSVLFAAIRVLATRANVLRNAATPFECGFDPKGSARTPFSLRFFLLAVIFLIFDVEVVVLLPIVIVVKRGSPIGVGAVLLFLSILLMGLFHEWREGSLD